MNGNMGEGVASHADILLARHAIFPPNDCVMSQKNVCVPEAREGAAGMNEAKEK